MSDTTAPPSDVAPVPTLVSATIADRPVDGFDAMTTPALVHALHDGSVAPDRLHPDDRRRCVAHLQAEGWSIADTAAVLRCCERTVVRDRAAARAEGRVEPSLTLGDELLGRLERLTEDSVRRLTRLAADADAPAYTRVWAEREIAALYGRYVDTARKLGYFPPGTARVTHLERTDPAARQRHRESLFAGANMCAEPASAAPAQRPRHEARRL